MAQRKHAVVIGAGMAGLMATRALSNHFERVSLLDRDDLPTDHTPRKTVPQTRHSHVLLARGVRIVEKYLPGVQADLKAAGATPMDFAQDIKFRTYYGWAMKPPTHLRGHQSSRWLLESCVRQRVRALPNVTLVPNTQVTSLVTTNGSVTGVETKNGSMHADLVVEACGKGTKFEKWLAALGYDAMPDPTVVDGLVGYSTRIFKAVPGTRDWRALYVQLAPGTNDHRAGSLFPIEDNQWQVTVVGCGGDYPPHDGNAFMDFVGSLRAKEMYEELKHAEPVTGVFVSRSTENLHKHLERAAKWPRGFIVTGDAAIHCNPIYGQGMSLASLEAEALDGCLAAGDDRLPERFFTAMDAAARNAWTLATTMDFKVPNYQGPPQPKGFKLITSYMERINKLVLFHGPTARRFAEVLHLLRSPNSLVHPRVLARALFVR